MVKNVGRGVPTPHALRYAMQHETQDVPQDMTVFNVFTVLYINDFMWFILFKISYVFCFKITPIP